MPRVQEEENFCSGFETLFTDIRIFSVVDREDNWSSEMYKYRNNIPGEIHWQRTVNIWNRYVEDIPVYGYIAIKRRGGAGDLSENEGRIMKKFICVWNYLECKSISMDMEKILSF